MTNQSQPPGWYPDPGAPGFQRWWDGRTWATQSAPQAVARTSGMGVASMVAGVSAAVFLSVPVLAPAVLIALVGLCLAVVGAARSRYRPVSSWTWVVGLVVNGSVLLIPLVALLGLIFFGGP